MTNWQRIKGLLAAPEFPTVLTINYNDGLPPDIELCDQGETAVIIRRGTVRLELTANEVRDLATVLKLEGQEAPQ